MSIKNPPIPRKKPETPYRYTAAALTDGIKNFVKGHEKYIPHFYKDTNNNITIGTGHRVADADYAATLPLYWYESSDKYLREATATEKKTAFEHLRKSALSGNIKAEKYDPEGDVGKREKLLKIGIKEDDDDFLLQSTLRQNIGSLEKKFSDFPKYPEPARTALIDMEYNLGRSGFGEKIGRICIERFVSGIGERRQESRSAISEMVMNAMKRRKRSSLSRSSLRKEDSVSVLCCNGSLSRRIRRGLFHYNRDWGRLLFGHP